MNKIQDAPISRGNRILVRCDLDVPIKNGKIQEKYRLESSLETLNYIINKEAMPIIAGHIGKPDGKYVKELSTKYLKSYFEEELGSQNFQILENLRFDPREEENSMEYANEICKGIDMYVNESFATCHRKHTSIVSIPKILPHYAGFHLQQEIETLITVIENPEKPLVFVVGGVKLESKKPAVVKFLNIADCVLLGGKLAEDWKEDVPSNLILPMDDIDGKDIGPKTVKEFNRIIDKSKTILWAGPMGMFEDPKYQNGTKSIAFQISKTTDNGSLSVIGGGDTISAVEKFGFLGKYSFTSTGGGAMLQFLSEGTLPGIEALE
ncbi:MAG TPA: phosphoglycerate kinase [bacterium]|nr:phosphoglycerate kinase [bacterium]